MVATENQINILSNIFFFVTVFATISGAERIGARIASFFLEFKNKKTITTQIARTTVRLYYRDCKHS